MLVVFVAKDYDEFVKYARGLGLNKWPDNNTDARLVWVGKNSNELVFCCVYIKDKDVKETTRNNLNEGTSPGVVKKFLEKIKGILTMPRSYDEDAEPLAFLSRCFTERTVPQNEKKVQGRARRKVTIRSDSSAVLFPKTTLFIHWGGGTPIEYENYFSKACKKFSAKMPLTSFAVSSRRENCFNVNTEAIDVPDTEESFNELVARFTFDLFKDDIIKYVVENEILRGKRRNIRRRSSVFKFSSKEVSDALRQYLRKIDRQELEKRFDSDAALWMAAALSDNAAMLDFIENKSRMLIKLDDNIAAFFTMLINEGGR